MDNFFEHLHNYMKQPYVYVKLVQATIDWDYMTIH